MQCVPVFTELSTTFLVYKVANPSLTGIYEVLFCETRQFLTGSATLVSVQL